MEWSWRTVLILLGLLLVAGVLFDGFRRMRKARAEALRFDLEKEVGSDELYHNPELPGTYRVVGSHTTDASYVDDPIFAQDDTEEVHVQEPFFDRSEEHTSELQSRPHLVCRLLLEKKKK